MDIKKVILVTGSRKGVAEPFLTANLDKALGGTETLNTLLIHGDAKGVDTQAKLWAMRRGIHVLSTPALWDSFDLGSAGAIRNKVMISVASRLKEASPGVEATVVAFPVGSAVGTRDCIKQAREADLEVHICSQQ